jgi:hypothetical protein
MFHRIITVILWAVVIAVVTLGVVVVHSYRQQFGH